MTLRLHPRRAFSRDLAHVPVADGERTKLAVVGVTAEPIQRYAVWRRSVLIVVLVPTLVAALLSSYHTLVNLHPGLSAIGKALTLANTLSLWALPVSTLLALRTWTHLGQSHRAIIVGWSLAFLPPFLIALVPLKWWFDVSGAPANLQKEMAAFDVINGLHVAFSLLPAVLAVLPGMVRACLRVKSLFPASILPGWFLVVAPTFYLLLALVALIALNHLAGGPLLVAGVLLSIGSPMVYVWRADLFVRPLPAEESSAVNGVQQMASVISLIGATALLLYVFTERVFGLYIMGWHAHSSLLWLWENHAATQSQPGQVLAEARSLFWVGDIRFSQLVIQYLGRTLFMTAVFSDILVRICWSVWKQEKQFAGSPAAKAYDDAMADLQQSLSKHHWSKS